jgi:multiple sugar transport system substrate-binding protein
VVELRGISWDHPRGMAPLRATAKRFEQEHPGVHIIWDARSLAAFGEQPIEKLAERYDLLVIDHPFVGRAARIECLTPLDTLLPADFLAEQARQSVGPSFQSYTYAGHQWALAIDAAAHVSVYREDLLEQAGQSIPQTWEQVLALAENAPIAVPLNSAGAIDCFLTLCASFGAPAGQTAEEFVDRETARRVFALLRQLVALGHADSLAWSPPQALDRMASTDEIVYCPLVFGYSNYSRPGFAPHLLRFTDIPSGAAEDSPSGALLGGTGLAISASCRATSEAAAYATYVASAECQCTLYVESGGQPGNRVAWTDPAANASTTNFFRDTLETLDHAYVRPRYDGFVAFHDEVGVLLNEYLSHPSDENTLLDRIDVLYRESVANQSE